MVATGLAPHDPRILDEYGYTRFENVLTSLEFERLVNAGGPTQGHLLRPTDRKPPKSIGFIQCVGSRSARRGKSYCSNVCCMNTIKSTLVLKEHYPDMEVKVFYIDIRAFGKGFEDLYTRSRRLGVHYVRGLPGHVEELPDGSLRVAVENIGQRRSEYYELDMLVLAIGIEPAPDTQKLQEMLGLQLTSDGFFLEAHPKLQPVDAATRGVFYAGCAEGPKDIKESVTQASAAAVRAIRLMQADQITAEAITSEVIRSCARPAASAPRCAPTTPSPWTPRRRSRPRWPRPPAAGCGTCAAECPFGAITMNHFTDAQIYEQIDAMLANNPPDKILTFACNWCSYAGADYAGVSRLQYPPNVRLIRTMCSGRVDEEFHLARLSKRARR